LISESFVKKFGLKTNNHPKPYPLGWLKEKSQIHVTKQCRLKFSITSNYIDEVDLDMISLDICGIVLGSPYLYDRDVLFYRKEHMYHLIKDGIKYIVRAHKTQNHLNKINANQMKHLISSSKRYILMSIKEQHKDLKDTCSGCEIQYEGNLVNKIDSFQDLVKKPKHVLHNKEISHEMQLIFDASNNGMCHKSVVECKEIKKQFSWMEFMRHSSSPYISPIILAHKQNGTWGMCVNFKVDSCKQKNFSALIDQKQPYEVKTDAKGDVMETVIHIDYQLLQYFQSYTKLQQSH